MPKIKLAQIGYGAWGPNLSRAFNRVENCELSLIVDLNPETKTQISKLYPNCRFSSNLDDAFADEIDALIIATPASSHFELAKRALESQKHVFVEKPLATVIQEAKALRDLAQERELTLMVGHVFLYHDALLYMKQNRSILGDLMYMASARLNFGKVRDDVNAWWNLAPHDISMMLYFKDNVMPTTISVQGRHFFHPNQEDFAHAHLTWEDGTSGMIQLNWFYPQRARKFIVAGTEKTIVFDDCAQEDKVEIYPMSISKENNQYQYYKSDVEIPQIEVVEPLFKEACQFVNCILNGEENPTDANHACDVVHILQAGEQSMKEKGKPIEISSFSYQDSTC